MLREFYPAALHAFDDLHGRDALAAAPTPRAGQALTVEAITDILRQAGRQRYLATTAAKIHTALHTDHLTTLPQLAEAYGAATAALVAIITEMGHQIEALEAQVVTHFGRHPDSEIYLSQPGLGKILGARVLGEFGDAAGRYANAKARRNYAGTSPITAPPGRKPWS
jgi:transposase